MPRYIDAEKAKRYYEWICDGTGTKLAANMRDIFKCVIDRQPTADVVEVVRCKECKNNWDGCGWCGELDLWVKPDDFCSYGERRETC